jgi:hypothetical protein
MTTALQPDTITELQTGTGPGQCAHIAKKGDVAEGYIAKVEIEALCGYKFVPGKSPKGLPVCQACHAVWDDDLARALALGQVDFNL